MHYVPLAAPFFVALFLFFALVVLLVEVRVLQFAYEKVGISQRHMLVLLLLSFLGSSINIPVVQLPPEPLQTARIIDFFGMRYMIPAVTERPGTVIAVNLGGAVIPTILSLYLVVKNRLYLGSLVAVGIVTAVVHLMSYPVPGVGIAEPVFIPPVVTAIVALAISRERAAPLAYVAGSLGTLIGADLLNLSRIRGLGAPVASIGGAGKFDGIFLTGLIAVLLASLATRRRRQSPAGTGG
ncbi:MAG: DUF1614 domain-containing protein [Gemmatimonadota bacterium]